MISFKFIRFIFISLMLGLLAVSLTSAKRSQGRKPRPLSLTSIHIVDRNGFSETISNKDRLNQYQNVDFLKEQPYQKILRIYARDSKGNIRSIVTTYHDNGNPKQFLEILNGRANGMYCEWHENGNMSLMSKIIGGTPDVTAVAEKSWLFDGPSYVWNEEGCLLAEINYSQGQLDGWSIYYHPSSQVWKRLFFVKNKVEGLVEIFKSNGELLQQMSYAHGEREGCSQRYWDPDHLASQEKYSEGKLVSGQYFNQDGSLLSEVKEGNGYRVIFGKRQLQELQQFIDGVLEGEIRIFNSKGDLKRFYHVKNGIKHGEEIDYYPLSPSFISPQPKLSFHWYEGKVHGIVKTWYPNGIIESQKEMSHNAKNGVLSAWYRDGNLMLIEEYEMDKLTRGDYFKKGEKTPISQVNQGKGVGTIFDGDGNFIQRINYVNGQPETR